MLHRVEEAKKLVDEFIQTLNSLNGVIAYATTILIAISVSIV